MISTIVTTPTIVSAFLKASSLSTLIATLPVKPSLRSVLSTIGFALSRSFFSASLTNLSCCSPLM